MALADSDRCNMHHSIVASIVENFVTSGADLDDMALLQVTFLRSHLNFSFPSSLESSAYSGMTAIIELTMARLVDMLLNNSPVLELENILQGKAPEMSRRVLMISYHPNSKLDPSSSEPTDFLDDSRSYLIQGDDGDALLEMIDAYIKAYASGKQHEYLNLCREMGYLGQKLMKDHGVLTGASWHDLLVQEEFLPAWNFRPMNVCPFKEQQWWEEEEDYNDKGLDAEEDYEDEENCEDDDYYGDEDHYGDEALYE
jgi:hypothetical protein